MPPGIAMSCWASEPDYALGSHLVRTLKATLAAGDGGALRELILTVEPVDAVLELDNDDWMKEPATQLPPGVLLGLWTLEYKRELTTPLRISAAHGHTACVRHLLRRGADPDASPGGRGALHEACLGEHTACARLLLQHGADPDLLSTEGLAPLHLCRTAASLGCAQALLEHGASVQRAGGAGRDTPLHVAAQRGLDEHARLYLGRGARVDARNGRGETALSAACGAPRRPDEHARCLRLCALLLRHGATVDARDEDERSPLHKACGHARHGLAQLLLRHGADAGALDYGGASPLARVLQTAACVPEAAPQRTVQALLNHGSPTVWPDAFPKVRRVGWHVPQGTQERPPGSRPACSLANYNEPRHPWADSGVEGSAFLTSSQRRPHFEDQGPRRLLVATVTRNFRGGCHVSRHTRTDPWGCQALISTVPSWLTSYFGSPSFGVIVRTVKTSLLWCLAFDLKQNYPTWVISSTLSMITRQAFAHSSHSLLAAA
uniref:Ankyrin repeat and SOCS box protein 18 n=2 Tax=Castor canadensis TaxID=51338 RepID=A0A8C0WN37_CASCN